VTVLLIDKPSGPSSLGVVKKVQGMVRAQRRNGGTGLPDPRKAGHGGTLDPMASGLLVLLLGQATKIAPFMLGAEKSYRATLQLGVETDTLDAEGTVLARRAVPPLCDATLDSALNQFRGFIEQVPPLYSALKRDGKPLYALARQGQDVERPARPVNILELRIEDRPTRDSVTLFVRCSKGTYIRSLAADIGRALGCGAHLSALRRLSSGPFSVDRAFTLEQLQTLADSGSEVNGIDLVAALHPMQTVCPPPEVLERIRMGQKRPWKEVIPADAPPVEVFAVLTQSGGLAALVKVDGDGLCAIVRGFNEAL